MLTAKTLNVKRNNVSGCSGCPTILSVCNENSYQVYWQNRSLIRYHHMEMWARSCQWFDKVMKIVKIKRVYQTRDTKWSNNSKVDDFLRLSEWYVLSHFRWLKNRSFFSVTNVTSVHKIRQPAWTEMYGQDKLFTRIFHLKRQTIKLILLIENDSQMGSAFMFANKVMSNNIIFFLSKNCWALKSNPFLFDSALDNPNRIFFTLMWMKAVASTVSIKCLHIVTYNN